MSRGRDAYERAAAGATWREIEQDLGFGSRTGASSAAQRHAKAHGLPWPLKNVKGRSAEAYALAVAGATWAEVAEVLGFATKDSACATAGTHARAKGLPWPLRHTSITVPGRAERAYRMALDGVLWEAIAAELAYADTASAWNCARDYARRHDLPWPHRQF